MRSTDMASRASCWNSAALFTNMHTSRPKCMLVTHILAPVIVVRELGNAQSG